MKINMQAYSLPKRGGGAFQYASHEGSSQMGPKGHILSQHVSESADVDNININVNMEANKAKVTNNSR